MASVQTIEDRLATLEREVAQLRTELKPPDKRHWLEEFKGAFADEPAFDEVIRYGRELRQADRPPDIEADGT